MSEIHITECLVDPWFIPYMSAEFCTPPSTKEDDAKKGKWVLVERNLKSQLGMKSLVRLTVSPRSHPIIIFPPHRTCTIAERGDMTFPW